MKFDRQTARLVTRILYAAGILLSLATFVLHAIPVNWGIFLSSACFIIGGMLWGGMAAGKSDVERSPERR